MSKKKPASTQSKSRTATAIDAGAHAIKIATVTSDEQGHVTLDRWTSVTVDGSVGDTAAVTRSLQTAVSRHGQITGTVVSMIPRQRAVVRYVTLPSVVPDEIEEIMDLEVERHSPIPAEEVEMGYQVVAERSGTESDVQMVAASRNDLVRHVDLLTTCDIEPDVIEVSGMNIGRAYLTERLAGETIAVVDVGRTQATVSIWRQGFTRFSRGMAWGADRLQTFLQGGDEPLSLAELDGNLTALERHPGWELWSSRLETELRRTFAAFEHDRGGTPIRRIHFTGGLSDIEAVVQALRKRLPYELETARPVGEEMRLGSGVEPPPPAMADCIGTAIRAAQLGEGGINLVPQQILASRRAARRKQYLRNCAMLGLAIVLLLGGSVYLQWLQRHRALSSIEARLADIQPKVRKVRTQQQKLESLNENIDSKHSAFKILHDIYLALPDDSNIGRFAFTKQNEVFIQGEVFEDQDVLRLGNILRALTSSWDPDVMHFSRVEAGDITRKPIPGTGIVAREYEFTCILSSKPERPTRGRRR